MSKEEQIKELKIGFDGNFWNNNSSLDKVIYKNYTVYIWFNVYHTYIWIETPEKLNFTKHSFKLSSTDLVKQIKLIISFYE